MPQTSIPFLFQRGGTSRGPYFRREDLPADRETLAEVLMAVIDEIEVTCIDVAMPMAIARADAFGLTGYESREELDENRDFYARMEPVWIAAGRRMGLGDVTKSVVPKFGVLATPRDGGTVSACYFMPWNCHPTMAVTGAQCVASCVLTPGTVAEGIAIGPGQSPAVIVIEHGSGRIEVTVDFEMKAGELNLRSAGLVRTARLLARGEVMIPGDI